MSELCAVEALHQGESDHQHLEKMLKEVDENIASTASTLRTLLAARYELFEPHSDTAVALVDDFLDPAQPLDDQLYPDEAYNEALYRNDLDPREWGVQEYSSQFGKLSAEPGDSESVIATKAEYRDVIRHTAQESGFVSASVKEPSSDIDALLGIVDSDLVPITEPVEAIIVPGAAGLTNHKRLRDALKNITSGTIDTDHIIMTACSREVKAPEESKLTSIGLSGGATEFELCLSAVHDLTSGFLLPPIASSRSVQFPGGEFESHVLSGVVVIEGPEGPDGSDKEINIDIVDSAYDHTRTLRDGTPATRAISHETFMSAISLMSDGPGRIVVESHDAWAPTQALIAQRVFGIQASKTVSGTGPFNADRLFVTSDGNVDLNKAEEVVSEMSKYLHELVQLRIALAGQLQPQKII